MSINQSRIKSLRNEISRLKKDLSSKNDELRKVNEKASKAADAARKAKTANTQSNKLREVERRKKEALRLEGKINEIQKKLGKKESELSKYEAKAEQERQKSEQSRQKEHDKKIQQLDKKVNSVEGAQYSIAQDVLELKKLPDRITVLFLASNPMDQDHLRLDEEARSIQKNIRMSEYRDSIDFESHWAVRTGDLLQAINETEPTIIHFSGHGADTGELVLQDNEGNTKLVTTEAIVQMVKATSDKVRLIFFNTCHSFTQAEKVVDYVEASIGMNTGIGDETAQHFSAQFYSAIGFGKSVHTAFEQAKAKVMLENIPEEDIPQLCTATEVAADDLVLVKSDNINS